MPARDALLRRLLKRSEFLRAAQGRRLGRTAFQLQAIDAPTDEPGLGLTVTKRIGTAPERNRIKRRLREAARACETGFLPRHDYVLVGRREALSLPFGTLVTDLSAALSRIHRTKIEPGASGSRGEE